MSSPPSIPNHFQLSRPWHSALGRGTDWRARTELQLLYPLHPPLRSPTPTHASSPGSCNTKEARRTVRPGRFHQEPWLPRLTGFGDRWIPCFGARSDLWVNVGYFLCFRALCMGKIWEQLSCPAPCLSSTLFLSPQELEHGEGDLPFPPPKRLTGLNPQHPGALHPTWSHLSCSSPLSCWSPR